MNTAAYATVNLQTLSLDADTPGEALPTAAIPALVTLRTAVSQVSPLSKRSMAKHAAEAAEKRDAPGLIAFPFTRAVIDSIAKRAGRQTILHHWECSVQRIDEASFEAILRSLRDATERERLAEIPIDEVGPDDIELLTPGAIFYWSVGYHTSGAGTRTRFSSIKFRRLPAWTTKDLARAEARGDELYEMFGQDQDARDAASDG